MRRIPFLLALVVASAFAADPFLGTWKLNPAKSSSNSAFDKEEMPRQLTISWGKVGDKLRVSGQGMDSGGKPFRYSYDPVYDGKEYPPSGPWNWDFVANNQIDEYTREDHYKKNGKVIRVERRTVSNDGKALTYAIRFDGPRGQATGVLVFDRVD